MRGLEVKRRELINIPTLRSPPNTRLAFLFLLFVLVRVCLSFLLLRVLSPFQVTDLIPPFCQLLPNRVFSGRDAGP